MVAFRPLIRSLLVFALLSALLLVSGWQFYGGDFHEQGDIALNALQIDRAKHFDEIYGNYSRFHFNHPGPAFFYVYAVAERVLTDTFHWVSPHAAHSIAGALLQVGFFTLGLHLLSRFTEKAFFWPVALLLAAVHFSHVGWAFISIWPPHVLLMPFFAFWAACLSVAMGRGKDLGWLALSGCFLVHAHVAQPVFVGTLTLVAYVLFWRSCRLEGRSPLRDHWLAHAIALVVIAVFVTPMLIDLAKGEDSNLQAIFRHLRYAGDKKKFIKTVLYFLSFFAYLENQDVVLRELSWSSADFLRDHWFLMTCWLAWVIALVVCARRGFSAQPAQRRFLRVALLLWAVTAGLCLYWGRMQTGAMFQYNGYFFFSVTYVLLALGAFVIAEKWQWKMTTPLSLLAFGVAGFLGWKYLRYPEVSASETGVQIRDNTLAALAVDPQPKAPKLLVFAHDYWPVSASVALALQRAGATFYVDPSWTFMYQKRHEVPLKLVANGDQPLSVWRVMSNQDTKGLALSEKLVITQHPAELSPSTGEMDFSDHGNYEQYQVIGFSTPQAGDYAPTAANDVILQFKALPTDHEVQLHMIAEPFVGPGNQRIQPTELWFNGHLVFSAPFTEPGILRAAIPKDMWNERPVATIHLGIPRAQSPAEMGISGDVRKLGLSVKKLTTRASYE